MGKFRDGAPVTQDAVSLILISIDQIKEILGDLEAAEGDEPQGDDSELIGKLEACPAEADAAMAGGGAADAGGRGAAEEKSADERFRSSPLNGRCGRVKFRSTNSSVLSVKPTLRSRLPKATENEAED
jgi:hypothetical protein